MKRFHGIIAAIALSGSLGCASGSNGPRYVGGDFEAFFEPYRDAFRDVAPEAAPDRQLIHLGLPDTNKVVLWYALEAGAVETDPLRITLDGLPLSPDRAIHSRNDRYRTGRVEIAGLRAGTTYEIDVSGGGLEPRTLRATTRIRGDESFSFLFASCFTPYNSDPKIGAIGTIGAAQRASMANFRERARTASRGGPSFFIGLGDQMYTDPGASDNAPIAYLFGGRSRRIRGTAESVPDYLNSLYRFSFGLPSMDSAFASVPSVMMWDDHDIRDGWGSQRDEDHPEWRRYYQHARDAFVAFQAARNPNFTSIVNARRWSPAHRDVPLPADAEFAERQVEETHFSFDYGEYATFFIADGRSAKQIGPQLIGRQYDDIHDWLTNPERSGRPTVFVFAFPVPVAANIGTAFSIGKLLPFSSADDARDRIHREDRAKLLNLFARHFADQPRHTLVIISGDVHYSGLQSIRQGVGGRTYGYEIISSGLAQTEYNPVGPALGAVSGAPRRIRLDRDIVRPWLQDHGFYAGPSFAELFISAPQNDTSPPRLALEFYPAEFDSIAYNLRSGPGADGWPHAIDAYPENELGEETWWGTTLTTNALPGVLREFWVTSGRATPVP